MQSCILQNQFSYQSRQSGAGVFCGEEDHGDQSLDAFQQQQQGCGAGSLTGTNWQSLCARSPVEQSLYGPSYDTSVEARHQLVYILPTAAFFLKEVHPCFITCDDFRDSF